MDYGTDGTMTLSQAGALAEILHAAQRNAPVVRLDPATGRIETAQARYIGAEVSPDGGRGLRDFAYESAADVRDLFLVAVSIELCAWLSWPVRELMAEYAVHTFAVDLSAANLAEPWAVRKMAVLVSEGRRWIANQPQLAARCAPDLSDDAIRATIGAVYEGGWAKFVADGPHPR